MTLPLFLILIFLFPSVVGATHATGNDDSSRAGDVASCNASFQEDCPPEHNDSTSSDSVAAPIGSWGDSTLETLVLIVIVGGALRLRMMRQATAQ